MIKEVSNYMKIEFPSEYVNRTYSSKAVAEFVKQLNPTVEEVDDVKNIVAEAVGNAIDHAYLNNKHGKITVKVSLLNKELIEIKVIDKGCGIDDTKKVKEPLFTTDLSRHAGLGFSVMESFSDKISIKSKPGKGTTVTIKKHIKKIKITQ